MAKTAKTFKIKSVRHRNGQEIVSEGTVEELTRYYSYTLSVGASYSHERGNAKINTSPRGIRSLVSNLNKAVNNAAANGYAGITYEVVEETA